jgi:hypothetical protein
MKDATRQMLFYLTAGGVAFAAGYAVRPATVAPGVHAVVAAPPASAAMEPAAQFSKAWTTASAERDPVRRTESLVAMLANSGAATLRRLAAQSTDDPDTLALILQRWATIDPRAAARWTEEAQRDGKVTEAAMDTVVETWAASDPKNVASWLKEPSHTNLQYRLMEKLTGALFARDPAEAFAMAKDFPRTWRLPQEAMKWVLENPAAAARTLGDLPLDNNLSLTESAVRAWAATDAPAAAAWMAQLEKKRGAITGSITAAVLETWARQDPVAAANFLTTQLRTQPASENRGKGLIKEWAAKDAAAALAWIGTSASPSDRSYMAVWAVDAAAKADLPATAALVAQMSDGAARDKAIASLASVWAGKDPGAALEWIGQLPPGPARNDSLARTAAAWAGKDAAAAAAWAKEAPEGSLPPQAYAGIMDHLIKDTAAAYAWLNELPASGARRAAEHFIGGWRDEDVVTAVALPDGPYKAQILDKAVTGILRRDPDKALAWALALPNGPERETVRQTILATEPVAEARLFNALTAAKKQELLQKLK